ncbi:MAG: helix-turn-helix transcriptional regulator, partial [Patescibacteria group bacterium]
IPAPPSLSPPLDILASPISNNTNIILVTYILPHTYFIHNDIQCIVSICMKNNNLSKFGQRLRELRKKQDISQGKLSGATGLHRTYISGIERGIRNPSLKNIQKLAHALKVSPKEFFN